MKKLFNTNDNSGKSSRPLKVGEMIKRALTEIIRDDLNEPALEKTSVIISEVVMTPDLKLARIYLFPMVGGNLSQDDLLTTMKQLVNPIKRVLAKKVYLRYMPELHFLLDTTFDSAANLEALLKNFPK